MSLLAPLARVWARERFVSHFMLLALASGTTISMAQLATTLYALKLGASTAQIGVISSMESLGMVFMTLPAGFLVARYGARRVYFIASAGPMLLNFMLPWTSIWYAIALTQWLIGLCIPFRIVSMNGAFLSQLKRIGLARAGWYRAFMSIGMGMLGPWLATWLIAAHGYGASFVVAGSCFAAMALFSRTVLDDAAPAAASRAADWRAGLAHLRALTGFAEIRESLAVEALSSATKSLASTFIVVLAIKTLGLPQQKAVRLLMMQGVVAVVALFGLGHLARRLSHANSYRISLVCTAGGLTALGTGHSFGILMTGVTMLGVGSSLLHLINMMQLGTHSADKNTISGLYNLASMSGSFCGAMGGGVLSRYVGLQATFLWWLPLIALASIALWRLRVSHAKQVAHRAAHASGQHI